MSSLQTLLEKLNPKNYLGSKLATTLYIILFLVGLRFLWIVVRRRLLLKSFPWNKVRKGWAVITGATDGIGMEFAKQLHFHGVNLILIGRNPEKLKQTSESLKNTNGKSSAQIKTITLDLSADGHIPQWIDALQELSQYDTTLLINCAGMSYDHPEAFHIEPVKRHEGILAVNTHAVVKLTHAILPGMVQRRFGIVWNVGSMTAGLCTPMLATYAASKAFLRTFSEALHTELSGTGVSCELLDTYYVVRQKLINFF